MPPVEYFPALKTGIIFHIPRDFLQIYRCEGRDGDATLEWMYKPVTLAPGANAEFTYEMEVIQAAGPEEFGTALKRQRIP